MTLPLTPEFIAEQLSTGTFDERNQPALVDSLVSGQLRLIYASGDGAVAAHQIIKSIVVAGHHNEIN
jgi:hypothetical protein